MIMDRFSLSLSPALSLFLFLSFSLACTLYTHCSFGVVTMHWMRALDTLSEFNRGKHVWSFQFSLFGIINCNWQTFKISAVQVNCFHTLMPMCVLHAVRQYLRDRAEAIPVVYNKLSNYSCICLYIQRKSQTMKSIDFHLLQFRFKL